MAWPAPSPAHRSLACPQALLLPFPFSCQCRVGVTISFDMLCFSSPGFFGSFSNVLRFYIALVVYASTGRAPGFLDLPMS